MMIREGGGVCGRWELWWISLDIGKCLSVCLSVCLLGKMITFSNCTFTCTYHLGSCGTNITLDRKNQQRGQFGPPLSDEKWWFSQEGQLGPLWVMKNDHFHFSRRSVGYPCESRKMSSLWSCVVWLCVTFCLSWNCKSCICVKYPIRRCTLRSWKNLQMSSNCTQTPRTHLIPQYMNYYTPGRGG